MTNPQIVFKTAYRTEEDARAEWSKLHDNDRLEIQALMIDLVTAPPTQTPVCRIIVEKSDD